MNPLRSLDTLPRRTPLGHLPTGLTLLLTLLALILGGAALADVLGRDPPGGTVPNPGTQQQEMANITAPAPYNIFEFVVTCAGCHGGSIDQQAGHFGNWAGSSMASSARDPFFRANQIAVNAAVKGLTGQDGAGNLCFRCHSPNGWYSGRFDPLLNGAADGSSMIHSIVLSTDDEGILCEACHRSMGNVTMKRADLDPTDPVWSLLAGITDWPHAGGPFFDQVGDLSVADGNPYGDTSLQIADGVPYIAKYSGSVDMHMSDLPTAGTYTGQTYGIYPDGWLDANGNDVGGQIVVNPDGSVPTHFEEPIGPPIDPDTGKYVYMAQALSLEHPTAGDRGDLLPQPVPDPNKFIRSSEFCGTCHELTVPILNHGMPEQRTYTEWKFSEFGDGDGIGDLRCQDCHMPTQRHEYSDAAPASLNPDPMITGWFPYAKDRSAQGGTAFHKFAGANRDLPMAMQLLYPEPDMEVTGAPTGNDPRIFPGMLSTRDSMYERNRRNSEIMLQEAVSAEIVAGPTCDAAGSCSVQVKVTNNAGHRIPSGYPDGRRFWLALTVTDAATGATVYESGHYDPASATLYTDSSMTSFTRALSPTIDAASSAVMVYERVTGTCVDATGNLIFPTPSAATPVACTPSPALTNNFILFDNRILPEGFTYADLSQSGVKLWNYDPATFVPFEDARRYPDGQNWDEVTYTFTATPGAALSARAELYWQTHTREFVEHLRAHDDSTLRPEGPPNILDPNYPLNPTYLSDVIGLTQIVAEMQADGFPGAPATLNDNWGGIAYATWYATGKGAPFLVAAAEVDAIAPNPPATVTIYPTYDANGVPIDGVIDPITGLLQPYSQRIVWDAVPEAEGYRVWVRYGVDEATAAWDRLAIVPAPADPAATTVELINTALNVNKTYGYKVQAFNAGGTSTDSVVAEGLTPWDFPLPPENLQFLSSTGSAIAMTWYDPNDNELGHIVFRQAVPPTEPLVEIARIASPTPPNGIGAVLFTDGDTAQTDVTWAAGYTAPQPSSCYNYVVEAYNASGNSGQNANGPVQMCTLGVPGAPTLAATVINAYQVDLAWTAATGTVTGYLVQRSLDGGVTWALLADLADPAALSYSDTAVQPATTYAYRVIAYNAVGSSSPSNVVSVTTPAVPPLAPSNLTATGLTTAAGTPAVALAWVDNATNEQGFLVERADDVNGVPGTYTLIATIPTPDTVSYLDETVAPKTTYWYRVAAYNANGSSVYSNAVSVVTPGEIPQAPANLRVTATTKTTISLAWEDKSTNEVGFYLERSPDGLAFARIATLGANVTTHLDDKLKKGTTYWYRVQAFNADGVSAYSNVASGTTTLK